MGDLGTLVTDLPLEQQAIKAKCRHPSGTFIEFSKEEVERSIPARFERMVRRHPDHLAVKTRHHEFTYEVLNHMANRIARAILSRRGKGQEPIALLLENEASMIGSILAVLKTGKMYVPLDPSLPRARLADILEDSQAGLIVTNSCNLASAVDLSQGKIAWIDVDRCDSGPELQDVSVSIAPDALAWIIYTSGSTGQPKGVVQNHRNVLQFVRNYCNGLHLSASDRLSHLFSFQVQLLSALLNGASLHPWDIRAEGLTGLPNWLVEQEITVYCSVPTVFRHFCQFLTGPEEFPKLRLIILTGEPVTKKDVELYRNHFSSDCILINRLGSTETGAIRWNFITKETPIDGKSVPVGYPVPGNKVLLLDERGKEVPAGEAGEIAVKSQYLSPGYWRKPELSKKAFFTDPHSGDRIYRSGDLGRMLSDGCLMHLGRNDFQVKIRGYRVEVAEIEVALLRLGSIKEAVVHAPADHAGEQRLVAYLVPAARRIPPVSELRRTLAKDLPDYMLPSDYVFLDALPALPNGKVDRRALPPPSAARGGLDTPFVAPRTSVEETLARIWSEVLRLDRVGIQDNFLELGGNSLSATQVISRVIERFELALPIQLLFEAPTVQEMAAVIARNQRN